MLAGQDENMGSPIPKEERPSCIIAADFKLFTRLFTLLDVKDKDTQTKVWELLCRIPTSLAVSSKIKDISQLKRSQDVDESVELGALRWSDLFPGSNLFGRLYALQIVDQLVSNVVARTVNPS